MNFDPYSRTMVEGDSLQCYNTSCGQKFKESENNDQSCVYHTGKPYFHDGYKEWTCCKLKSADFTTFLAFKGCVRGPHNKVKPPVEVEADQDGEEEKKKPIKEEVPEVEKPVIEAYVPPNADQVDTILVVENPNVANAAVVTNKMICKNCKQEESTLDMTSGCNYHRGIQIFHDALKFWSCCAHRKFTEFDDFQKQPPCAHADSHSLIIKIDTKENWFQAGETITLALYGLKGARLNSEAKSRAQLRGGKILTVEFFNANGVPLFERSWTLFDYVLPSSSKITLNQSNVQIVLRKANPNNSWKTLVEESKDVK